MPVSAIRSSAGALLVTVIAWLAFTLPDHDKTNPAREAVRVCDGGAAFWGAVYDPQTGSFSGIATNGGF